MSELIIRARAPLRLGLAGGGTDVAPYSEKYGGAVLNATIDRYAYAVIKISDKSFVRFIASDKNEEFFSTLKSSYDLDGNLNLHKAVYNRFVNDFNNGNPIPMVLSTYCDAPIGSGLGSSSTLVVAIIKAFVELLNLPFDDYDIASLAYKIERYDCALQGGHQDQYSAAFGGFNFMEFYENDKVIVNALRIKKWILCEMEASLVLYFTGVSRESAKIISDQSLNVSSGVSDAIQAMHHIKDEAYAMKNALLKGDFESMVHSMKMGWLNKKNSAKSVSNPRIDEIYNAAISAGALAGKVSGAGGGGFMWFYAPSEQRMDVVRTLENFGGNVSNCHFTKNGCQAWRLN